MDAEGRLGPLKNLKLKQGGGARLCKRIIFKRLQAGFSKKYEKHFQTQRFRVRLHKKLGPPLFEKKKSMSMTMIYNEGVKQNCGKKTASRAVKVLEGDMGTHPVIVISVEDA